MFLFMSREIIRHYSTKFNNLWQFFLLSIEVWKVVSDCSFSLYFQGFVESSSFLLWFIYRSFIVNLCVIYGSSRVHFWSFYRVKKTHFPFIYKGLKHLWQQFLQVWKSVRRCEELSLLNKKKKWISLHSMFINSFSSTIWKSSPWGISPLSAILWW